MFARLARLLAAVLRPWAVAFALLGAAAAAFPHHETRGQGFSAGPAIFFSFVDWPHPRTIVFSWRVRAWPSQAAAWSEEGGWSTRGLWWTRSGADFGDDSFWNRPPGRPPGAATDSVSVGVSTWYLLGYPLVGSFAAAWWWLRRVRGDGGDDEAAPPRRPSSAWRFARPWAWVFAPVGAALLTSGYSGLIFQTADGSRVAIGQAHARRDPPGVPHPRVVTVSLVRVEEGPRPGRRTPPRAVSMHDWGLTEPPPLPVWGLSIGRRGENPGRSSGRPPGTRRTDVWLAVSLWLLLAIPAAANVVTFVRRRGTARRGGGAEPTRTR